MTLLVPVVGPLRTRVYDRRRERSTPRGKGRSNMRRITFIGAQVTRVT